MRPLTLHVSALSDDEYNLYTTSLNDLAADSTDNNTGFWGATRVRDDTYYERTSVGVREARAWLRGRYSDLPASDIDAIFRLFCPHMLPSDTLTGGQFFAAFRLVLHLRSGKGVDRTLAFVQACVASPKEAKAPDAPRPLSPPRRSVQAPPSHPDRQKAPPPATQHTETNPFMRKSTEHAAAPLPPPDSAATPGPPQQHFRKLSHNPFLTRDKPEVDIDKTPVNAPNHGKLPPLPPRKPSLLAVSSPRRPSEPAPTPIAPTANLIAPFGPPLVPLKPTHVMSPLMKQSLEASKHAQSMKRAEEQLDRERVLQVLKTTSSSSSVSNNTLNTRTRSLSPAKQLAKLPNGHGLDSGSAVSDDATYVPPLPRRRKPSLSSTASSVLSLEQVASAKLPSSIAAPRRPPLPSRDMHTHSASMATQTDSSPAAHGPGPIPPPKHPRRRPSTSTEPTVDPQPSPPSSPRVARSKSVTSSSSAPPPPPRRKRPESMQLTPTSDMGDLPIFPPVRASTHPHARTASFQGLSRHLSLSRDRERESDVSPIANIQRTLTHLQLKAQPKLDAVRYKAEAGISRRGYVHHTQLGPTRWREEGEQGLMTDTRWAAANVDQDLDSAPTTDEEPSSSEGHDQRPALIAKSTAPHRDFLTGSDNLKWPVGEGWKPL